MTEQTFGACMTPELQTAFISILGTAGTVLGGLAAKNRWTRYRYTNGHDRQGGLRPEDVQTHFLAWAESHDKIAAAHREQAAQMLTTLAAGQERIEDHLIRLDEKIDNCVLHHGPRR